MEEEGSTTRWNEGKISVLEVYMAKIEDKWTPVGGKPKMKMFLADSGANVHIVEDGCFLRNAKE